MEMERRVIHEAVGLDPHGDVVELLLGLEGPRLERLRKRHVVAARARRLGLGIEQRAGDGLVEQALDFPAALDSLGWESPARTLSHLAEVIHELAALRSEVPSIGVAAFVDAELDRLFRAYAEARAAVRVVNVVDGRLP
jgi:hypothetical protein